MPESFSVVNLNNGGKSQKEISLFKRQMSAQTEVCFRKQIATQ